MSTAIDVATELKREYLFLLRHPETAWYGSVFLLGKNEIKKDIPTAATNGIDCFYGEEFFASLNRKERRFLVLHENFHKAYKHMPAYRDYFKQDPKLANICCDYQVNSLIMQLIKRDPELASMPDGGLYDPMFDGWSVPDIWRYLSKGRKRDGGDDGEPVKGGDGGITIKSKKFGGEPIDSHEFGEGLTESQREEIGRKVDEALQQGGLLAGKMGKPIPRQINELLEPKVDWRTALAEFTTNSVKGRDEATWRKYNRKRFADGLYLPSTHKETPSEIVIAIDLSGSISNKQVQEFAAEIATICESVEPDTVRILWWDTEVRSEQVFTGHYANIREMLKPVGGGGTRASCISEYVVQKSINPDCLIVFTDGWLESDINWQVTAPTLWLVTDRSDFTPPSGIKVKVGN